MSELRKVISGSAIGLGITATFGLGFYFGQQTSPHYAAPKVLTCSYVPGQCSAGKIIEAPKAP